MNNVVCIIGLVIIMYIILKVYFMLQEKAPLIEKFLEGPFAPFKKQGGDDSIIDDGEEDGNSMISMSDFNLPVNYEIKKILSNYLKSNENCEIGRSGLYYKVFVTALRNFIRYNFLKTLGYVPDNDTLSVTDTREYRRYKKILQNIPDCYDLMKNFLKIDVNELDVQHGGQRVGKHSRTVKKLGVYTGDEHATYGEEGGTVGPPPEKPLVEDNEDESKDDKDGSRTGAGFLSQFTRIFQGSPTKNQTADLPQLSNPNTSSKPEDKDAPKADDQEKDEERSSIIYQLSRGWAK